MIEGIYFYWFSWVFWVLVTFFMKKNKKRTLFGYWILVSIIVSKTYITFEWYDISLTFISILIGGFWLFPHLERTIYHLFCSFTLMIGYASILIWEGQAPIWLFMPRNILIPLICLFLVCILARDLISRIAIALIGICSGELLYSHMLSGYPITNIVGELMFFDTLCIILMILIGIDFGQRLKQKVLVTLQNYKLSLRWQNE